jgi:hypothetical protein
VECSEDLKRMCAQSEYVYLYTVDALHILEQQLATHALSAANRSDKDSSLRWKRSIARLRQEIENTVIWSTREAGIHTHRLAPAPVLALRMLGTFHPPGDSVKGTGNAPVFTVMLPS